MYIDGHAAHHLCDSFGRWSAIPPQCTPSPATWVFHRLSPGIGRRSRMCIGSTSASLTQASTISTRYFHASLQLKPLIARGAQLPCSRSAAAVCMCGMHGCHISTFILLLCCW
jgi:hypothetical protein